VTARATSHTALDASPRLYDTPGPDGAMTRGMGTIAAPASPANDFVAKAWVRGIFRADSSVDHYDGEDEG